MSERSQPSNDRELEAFFQNWIFFGLLHEVLAKQGMYQEQDYIGTDDRGKFVHSRELVPTLQKWVKVMKDQNFEEQLECYDHLVSCLRLAGDVLGVLSQEPRHKIFEPDHNHAGFNRPIKLSLSALCELLMFVVQAFDVPEEIRRPPLYIRWTAWDEATEQTMVRHGWCPSEIAFIYRDFDTMSAQYYLQGLSKLDQGIQHSECDEEICARLHIDLATYQPAHVDATCNCALFGPQPEKIVDCLYWDIKTFPVLRICGRTIDDIKIDVLPYNKGLSYVALSHVWADGLGNPFAMELPRCQLLRLKSLVDGLQNYLKGHSRPDCGTELLLWCDTLCCPVEKSDEPATPKKRAIARMRDVYTLAECVLVLDRTLESCEFGKAGLIEASMRLFTSRWMRRLWTFHEAVLAKELVVQFAHGPVSLNVFRVFTQFLRIDNLGNCPISFDIERHCKTLQLRMTSEDGESGPDLAMVEQATRLRRVSLPNDEPLCISTILDLEVERMAHVREDKRMELLWENLPEITGGIHQAIVFNTFKRLQSPGFRWAPASMQASAFKQRQLRGAVPGDDSMQGRPTQHGLCVRLPAWAIKYADPPPDLPGDIVVDLFDARDLVDYVPLMDPPRQKWFEIFRIKQQALADGHEGVWDALSDWSKEHVLLFEQHPHVDTLRYSQTLHGLITSREEEEDGSNMLRSLLVVNVSIASANTAMIWAAAYERAMKLRQESFLVDGEVNMDLIEYRIREMAEAALADDALANAVERGLANVTPVAWMSTCIAQMFAGKHAVIGHHCSRSKEWCVD